MGLRTTAHRLNPTLKQGSQGLNHRNLYSRVTSFRTGHEDYGKIHTVAFGKTEK